MAELEESRSPANELLNSYELELGQSVKSHAADPNW